MRLFFVSDIHGSDLCFRKYISALEIYGADVGILLGDLAGKMVVPIIRQPDGTYRSRFLGNDNILRDEAELKEQIRRIEAIGFYYRILTQAEADAIAGDKAKVDQVFVEEMSSRLQRWVDLADEKLRGKRVRVYIAPGNDDPFAIDPVLENSKTMLPVDKRLIDLDGHEMVTIAYTTPTPWDTPRECSEEQLKGMIEGLVGEIANMERAIFNFHNPPYGTLLDLAPHLSKDLVVSAGTMVHVGSKSVLEALQQHQPLLGLHGHIHESRGAQKIGRTTIVNPGSEYGEGILKGVILELKDTKVKSYQFTSG